MRTLRQVFGKMSAILVLALVVTSNVALWAQQQDTFKPLSEQQQPESVSAPALLLAAYGFVWAAVFVYVFLLWQRLSKVERELADVNARLAKRATAR